MKSRRDFLKTLFGLMAAGQYPLAALAADKQAARQAAKKPVPLSEWHGDDFTLGHRFRIGDLPKDFPESPERQVEFVIVGGGIGGLSAAHYLRDHDVLLLEQYDQLGGQARGGTYRGVSYSYGSAYVGLVDGIYGKLYEDLGIKPEKLKEGDNDFFFENSWRHGYTTNEKNALYKNFKLIEKELDAAMKILPSEDTPQAMADDALLKLDYLPFINTLKNCSKEFVWLLDSICKSASCGTTGLISAAAGYYLVEDLRGTNYCFKGGNPVIARTLASKLNEAGEGRLQTGTFVWQVKLNENGADVFYTSKDGQAHHVACKHVIFAAPPMVAWRAITNLNDKMKIALMPFQYGSYMVANFLLNKKLFKGAYDNFVDTTFNFADFVIAETPYNLAGTATPHASVLTVYQPWEPGTAGRPLLLEGNREALAKIVHFDLGRLIDHLDDHLEEIVLSRWGHAMAVPTRGYYERLRRIIAAYEGPYSFAHCSTQGLPCAESAIRAGKFAAERAISMSTKTSMVVPIPL